MSADGLASVVLPSYNHETFLPAALDSIARQTHRRLEVIVVDDASSDGSVDLLRRWAAQPSTVDRFAGVSVIAREHNLGAHATINEGIAAAHGETIFLINSDDSFHPDRIARLVSTMEAGRPSLAFSRVRYIGDDGLPLVAREVIEYERDVDWIVTSLPSVSFGFLHRQWAVSTGNLAFTPELFEAVGGFADLSYCHDWDFVLRASLHCEPSYVADCLYDYRLHATNSFSQLGHLARDETAAVVARFWAAAMSQRATNPLAPTPSNWPGTFDVLADRVATREDLAEVRQVLPRYVTRRQLEAS